MRKQREKSKKCLWINRGLVKEQKKPLSLWSYYSTNIFHTSIVLIIKMLFILILYPKIGSHSLPLHVSCFLGMPHNLHCVNLEDKTLMLGLFQKHCRPTTAHESWVQFLIVIPSSVSTSEYFIGDSKASCKQMQDTLTLERSLSILNFFS